VLKGFAAALLLTLSALASASAAQARALDPWSAHISEASHRFAIPQEWIRRVIRAESGGWTMVDGRPITSRAGAMGLMQLMPGTWAEIRDLYGLGSDPYDPRDNILAGAAYLRAMYDRFGYPGLFAAYNAGPKRYAAHLATGRPLPAETVAYVAAVRPMPSRRAAVPWKPARTSSVFVVLASSEPRDADASLRPVPRRSLFVPLNTASAASE
jgi:soluble lytic murein transglycosylase-like protein